MEFKEEPVAAGNQTKVVLIESDWNLKFNKAINNAIRIAVLIESDWNLKNLKKTQRREVLEY